MLFVPNNRNSFKISHHIIESTRFLESYLKISRTPGLLEEKLWLRYSYLFFKLLNLLRNANTSWQYKIIRNLYLLDAETENKLEKIILFTFFNDQILLKLFVSKSSTLTFPSTHHQNEKITRQPQREVHWPK